MSADDPTPDYTSLAVQLGKIQEKQENTLDGIGEIKELVKEHGDRIGRVEQKTAVLIERVDTQDSAIKDLKPQRGKWANIGSFIVAAIVLVFFILDRVYLPPTH